MKACLLSIFFILLLMPASYGQSDEIVDAPDSYPFFAGCGHLSQASEKRECSDEKLVQFIRDQLKLATKNVLYETEGLVRVQFVVDKNGRVKHPEILTAPDEESAAISKQIINRMPDWEPAVFNERAVSVRMVLPIQFNISVNDPAEQYSLIIGIHSGPAILKKEVRRLGDLICLVRDHEGNRIPIQYLTITYQRKKTIRNETSQGLINDGMKKIFRKARKGGVLTFQATIQQNGEFIDVFRDYLIK